MAGRVEGKVAFVTGAARGQGRSHALRLAQEGADILAVDVWNTVEVAVPTMVEQGRGGAIVLTSSTAGLKGIGGENAGGLGYTASKHGVVGLMRSYATNLARHGIRVNTVHPTGVNTPMVVNDFMQQWLAEDPSIAGAMTNALPVEILEPLDISNAILWLVSDEARYVTGVTLPVDAGFLVK